MSPLERWYMRMRAEGHSQETIFKLFEDKCRGDLEASKEAFFKKAHEKLAHFEEVTGFWAKSLAASQIGEEEGSALDGIEKRVERLSRDTLTLKGKIPGVLEELREEKRKKEALQRELDQLKAQPKPPPHSYIPDGGLKRL